MGLNLIGGLLTAALVLGQKIDREDI
jgi:hypothetical protein